MRRKLLAAYLTLTFVGMGLLAGYILWSFYRFFLNTEKADLSERASQDAYTLVEPLRKHPPDYERLDELVHRFGVFERINIRVFAVNPGPQPTLTLLATTYNRDYLRPPAEWLHVPGIDKALYKSQSNEGVEDIPNDPVDELYEVRPMFRTRSGEMIGIMRMSLRLTQFQHTMDSLERVTAVSLVVAFLFSAVLSFWWTRTITEPLQVMRRFAARMGGGHFGERLPPGPRDEIGELTEALNRMSGRLASLDDERRAFLANVSHELRTPVSNIRLTLEALESGADEDPELRKRFMQTSLDETNRLARLVQDLLDLGRLEAGVVPVNRESLRLRDVVQRAVRAMESRARVKGLRVRVDVPDLRIGGDPERLLQALLNVLDNAIKHSVAESTVLVHARAEGAMVAIQIRDHGPGIAEQDLPHIFEQFYTADPSRKRSGGTGLGLAIARRIVEAHGGTINAVSTPGKGATFVIRLPLEGTPMPRLPRVMSLTRGSRPAAPALGEGEEEG